MTSFRPGDRVRDVYTGRRGRVVTYDADAHRLTVRLDRYTMTGCASWFDFDEGDE